MAITLPSFALQGLSAFPVHVEVDVMSGMPHFSVIGLAGTSVKEARDRVRSAITHSDFKFPLNRKVVNLAPAELRKEGSHFDLPIAIGLLVASRQIKAPGKEVMLMGELGLEGGIRGIQGVLPAVLFAKEQGFKQVVLPQSNLLEASLVEGIDLIPVRSLREVVQHFEGSPLRSSRLNWERQEPKNEWSLAHIAGHTAAKRALQVAATGGHHLLMSGVPGAGKSVLARAFPSLLPPLSKEELLEVLRVYSVAGQTQKRLHLGRPFRVVHQSMSPHGLIGGGSNLHPGEVSFAHRGVLFMDEFPEFSRRTIEMLRQPLEDKEIILQRRGRSSAFPCQFQLIAAMNPCPCGYYGDSVKNCHCSAADLARYQGKLSGPLLDRIDIQIDVPRIPYDELTEVDHKAADILREQVMEARERQRARWSRAGILTNQEMSAVQVRAEPLNAKSQKFLGEMTSHYGLSGRGVHRLIKVARSIADLAAQDKIQVIHLMEALQYRLR